MKVKAVLNNYMLGSRFHQTPIEKVVKQERIDSNHTEVIYEVVNEREQQSIEKMLYGASGKKMQKVED